MLTKAKYYANVFVPERAKPELNERSDGFPWVTTENLRLKYLNLESSKFFVSKKEAKKTGSRHLAANSVLATCVGTFGIAAINQCDCIINQQIQAYSNVKIESKYLLKLVELSEFYFKVNATMTTIAYVNRNVFADLPVLIPPNTEQSKIVDFLDKKENETDDAVMLQQQQIEKLREYKTTLINSAVTGKIRVTPEMVAV